MTVHTQISDYLAAQPERKRGDMQTLHDMMLRLIPDGRLWFLSVLEVAIRDGIARTSA
ncbi:MAG: hypothetical protein ACHQRK_10645 [Gemmatimonadales bacterium]